MDSSDSVAKALYHDWEHDLACPVACKRHCGDACLVARIAEVIRRERNHRVEGELTPMSASGSPSTSGRKAGEGEQTDLRPSGRHDMPPPCDRCGGPHPFDTTVPSPTWNRVIRVAGLPDYLCLTCIVVAFAAAHEGLTAELWGADFAGLAIEILIDSEGAKTAVDLSAENTALRARLVTP